MKYSKFLTRKQLNSWFDLKTSIGKNEEIVDDVVKSFNKFISTLSEIEMQSLSETADTTISKDKQFEIIDDKTLELVLVKAFMDSIGLEIIREARNSLLSTENEIFLKLADEVLLSKKYPTDIYTYAEYRRRGSPVTWLDIGVNTADEAELLIKENIGKLTRRLNTKLKFSRRFVGAETIGETTIFLLSKPTSTKMVQAEKRNAEVSGASFTMIVLDREQKNIGVVSGSIREVGEIHNFLRYRLFDNTLAPPRSDRREDGKEILEKLIKPSNDDPLITHSIELKKTGLAENPSLKLKANGQESIDEALGNLPHVFDDVAISELKTIDFWVPTDKVDVYKKMGLYTFGDEWKRTVINTSARSVPKLLEKQFLQVIKDRLGGIDIKQSRLLLKDLDVNFIIEKLVKDKTISTIPPIPADVEKIVVELTSKKLIKKQNSKTQRKCWNQNCFYVSWDQWECPSCGRTDMRIVSEAIKIQLTEQSILRLLSEDDQLNSHGTSKFHPRKSRNSHKKPVISMFDGDQNVSVLVLLIEKAKDIEYAETLISEGFGVIALIDPKIKTRSDEIKNIGCSVVNLSEILVYLIGKTSINPILTKLKDQQDRMLERLFENARLSLGKIRSKRNYNEGDFEIDLKNLIQSIVPDVVRLGTEFTGSSVPDGYSKYGVNGKRGKGSRKKIFGWDAKFSYSDAYSLGDRDVAKQLKYIKWLDSSEGEAAKFGKTKCYAIISNFSDKRKMDKALSKLANSRYVKSNKIRIVLVNDLLLAEVCGWVLENWSTSLEHSTEIADMLFAWLRRPLAYPFTVSDHSDWVKLKAKLDKFLS